jgi:hypothetical protein
LVAVASTISLEYTPWPRRETVGAALAVYS